MQMFARFICFFILFIVTGCNTQVEWFSTNPSTSDEENIEIASLSLNYNSPLILEIGQTSQLMLTVQLSNGEYEYNITSDLESGDLSGNVVWFSNDSDVISVDSVGVITAMNSGQTTVKADLLGFSDTLDIVVQEPEEVTLTQLNFHDDSLESNDGQAFTVTLDTTLSDGTSYEDFTAEDSTLDCSLIFSSSHEDIATISSTGLVTPVSNGSTNLTVACGDISALAVLTVSGFLDQAENIEEPIDDDQEGEVEEETETLQSLTITRYEDEAEVGTTNTFKCRLVFNTGTVSSVSNSFVSPDGNIGSLSWSSSNAAIATVSRGVVTYNSYGESTITAGLNGLSDSVSVQVKKATEDASTIADYYLKAETGDVANDEVFNITYGDNYGFGSSYFPGIVTGQPWDSGTDVVSFGGGGFLEIELKGYIIVDGEGIDFTIFENPTIYSGYELFAERAKVFVKANADDDWVGFPCDYTDTDDQIYEGCAGVNIVYAMEDPLNPAVSGGDQFDLADIGLEEARFILIQDMDTCQVGDPTESYCAWPTTQGFDLDAMAIINGVNE